MLYATKINTSIWLQNIKLKISLFCVIYKVEENLCYLKLD